MRITVLQLHKRASYEFKYIQDKYAIKLENRAFALADGTTQSFNSEFWAEIITSKFVHAPSFNPNKLLKDFTECVQDYKSIKFEYSTNPAKASLERTKQSKGATATFIGLQFMNESEFKIIACGDSNLFLVSEYNSFTTYPFDDVDILDGNNHFINTEQLLQEKLDSSFFKTDTINYKNGDKIILATDALSRLILNRPSVLKDIVEISEFDQLLALCVKYWDNKELQEDDISAIILSTKQDDNQIIIQPGTDFSFPKEIEETFIPESLQNPKLSDVQVNDIMTQFNGVALDFQQVKNKLWFHGVLLISIISVFVINTLLLFYLVSKNGKEDINKKDTRSEIATNSQYQDKINNLTSEIKALKEKIAQTEKHEDNGNSTQVTSAEALIRQKKMIEAGYTLKADGKWGKQSEKLWSEYNKSHQ